MLVCTYMPIPPSASKPQKIVQLTEDNNMTSSGSDFNYPQILCVKSKRGNKVVYRPKTITKMHLHVLKEEKINEISFSALS